jgi:glycosyltransferase involved in cell wall biosynthesis
LPELALGAAITVKPDDVGAIASALERLLSDEKLRSKLGEEGKHRAESFTWDRAAGQTLAVLRRIGSQVPHPVAAKRRPTSPQSGEVNSVQSHK